MMKKLLASAALPVLMAAGLTVSFVRADDQQAQEQRQQQRAPQHGGQDDLQQGEQKEDGSALKGEQVEKVEPGMAAPEFELRDKNGDTHRLADLTQDGKIVVLEWFDPECQSVRKHHIDNNTIEELRQRFKDRDVEFLAVYSEASARGESLGSLDKRGGQEDGAATKSGEEQGGQLEGQTDPNRSQSKAEGEGGDVIIVLVPEEELQQGHQDQPQPDTGTTEPRQEPFGGQGETEPRQDPFGGQGEREPFGGQGETEPQQDPFGGQGEQDPFGQEEPKTDPWAEQPGADEGFGMTKDCSFDQLVERLDEGMQDYRIEYPILIDDNDELARKFNIKTTPQIVIIDRQGKLAYIGAIDDNAGRERGQVNYVAQALEQLLAGQQVTVSQTEPYGCKIDIGYGAGSKSGQQDPLQTEPTFPGQEQERDPFTPQLPEETPGEYPGEYPEETPGESPGETEIPGETPGSEMDLPEESPGSEEYPGENPGDSSELDSPR